ncbi:mitogen-activated protein kinase kinase kinase 19-like [Elysia marginata]|uniref:Mitogen-activated protein kinase kinase kinase 19-like n=1 Tax=Elysia marginata TaxID=1093978 RepID=A0AAV4F7A6_9GAST|nr:mitogen-activated protein kinase kinase kinase 19-like [Elysia marginata]
MATRKPPWADMNPMAAIFAIGSSSRPVPSLDEKFSPEARDFVTLCLTRDQEKRPSAGELLDHIFLTRKSARKRQTSE